MGYFNITLLDHRVHQRGVNPLMAQQTLQLFNRHPFINRHCGQGPSEFMGMHFDNIQAPADFPQPRLDPAYLNAFVGRLQRNEQGRIIIGTACQIFCQVKFGPRIEVHDPFLVPFAEHHAFPLGKVYVPAVQQDHLADTHTG